MKKIYFAKILAGALVFSVLFTSCGKKAVLIDDELPVLTKATPKVTEPPVTEPPEEEEEVPVETEINMIDPDTTPHLKWGVWFAYNENECSYYFFENDNTTGTKVDTKMGVSTPFKYEKKEEGYVFHFDREDNNTPVTIEFPDNDHAVIKLPGNVTEQLHFVAPEIFVNFTFFTDEELERMAMNQYGKREKNKKKLEQVQVQIVPNADAQAIIQVFMDSVNQQTGADEKKVLECYTVSYHDACGTDAAGNPVDLSR